MFRVKPLIVVAAAIGLVAGASHADGWTDKLKSAADDAVADAAEPTTDAAADAAAKADEAKADATKPRTDAAHDAAASASSAESGLQDSLSETAKRAGGKGVTTATDSVVSGATAGDAAKKGGTAAVKEAMKDATK
jgi:hypothetical protein